MNTIQLNQNIGKAKAGTYKQTSIFNNDGFSTIFFRLVLKNGKVSEGIKNTLILNSTLNPKAPSVGCLDNAVEKNLISIID